MPQEPVKNGRPQNNSQLPGRAGPQAKVVRIDGHQVEAYHLRYTEAELRQYPIRKRRLAYLDRVQAGTTPNFEPGMPRQARPGDPTFAAVFGRICDHERQRLETWTRAVEDIFAALPQEQQAVIRLLLWRSGRITPDGVAEHLRASRPTVYRWKNRALLAFALVLLGDHIVSETNLIPSGLEIGL